MSGFTAGEKIKVKGGHIQIKAATINCSGLFGERTTSERTEYFLKPNQSGGVLRLSSLDPLRMKGGGGEDQEKFLPTKIFVRDCMQDIFNELIQSPGHLNNIVFGSPGVGKSVLTFLAALCITLTGTKPVLFMRKTKVGTEPVSVFWMQKSATADHVDVYFHRAIRKTNTLCDIEMEMANIGFNLQGEAQVLMERLRVICDGPRHDQMDDRPVGADLVTSGGYPPESDEQYKTFRSIPLSAWTLNETIRGMRTLERMSAKTVKAIFEVTGGNIRAAYDIAKENSHIESEIEQRRSYLDRVVKGGATTEQLEVAFESTAMSGVEKSIDRLRAMHTTKERTLSKGFPRYKTIQFIGSPYLLRILRSKFSLEKTLAGLRYAKTSGIRSLYGWHFELFGHKIFQVSSEEQTNRQTQQNFKGKGTVRVFETIQGCGTGKESVADLNRSGIYWMPSTSNFANIDAAIVINGVLYCIQYTVSKSHAFNYCTFVSNFWDELPVQVQNQITGIKVVFVVPEEVTFGKVIVPKSQKTICEAHLSAAEGVVLAYRKAKNIDDEDKEEEDEQDDDQDDDQDEDGDDQDEEGEAMEIETSANILKIHFQWEFRSEEFKPEELPLSFLGTTVA